MKCFKKVTIIRDELTGICCNMCGNEITNTENPYQDNFLNIEKRWGYGSDFDGEVHNIDLCLNCYKSFLESLRISPKNSLNNLEEFENI